MSIIYEVLKKVGELTSIRSLKDDSQKKEEVNKSKIKTYIIYVVTIIIGFVIANFIFSYLSSLLIVPYAKGSSVPPAVIVSAVPAARITLIGNSTAGAPVKEELSAPAKETLPMTILTSRGRNAQGNVGAQPGSVENRLSLTLNGIFFAEDSNSYAIINNQIVKEKDMIGDSIVKRITLKEVEVETDGVSFKLSISR